ncbi:glycoside hydrolase family 65 protein [Alkalibacillus haloalkaliphilus]|uniref:Glycosyl hydrolase n=1 Tax=Alkalibacillus haloalkaliphilus TaxID=94136 RepID=A0A511W691_9BACI|nr:glycosyl hydrolase family 65 protein [Alkalibacillus haloalkaliphilus]GEN46614.1 glycosyl hydrolase [Alkalibacillus haloalkaliphilus]
MTWQLSNTALDEQQLLVNESLMFLGNGYLGVRGNFEEGYRDDYKSIHGTYINAFHEETDIQYGEKLFGFPDFQQKLANVIDAQPIDVFVDGERFSLFEGEIVSFDRTLHMDEGYSVRHIHWRSPNGKEVKLTFTRVVSFVTKELFAIKVDVEPVTDIKEIQLVSKVNGDVTNYVEKGDPRLASGHAKLLYADQAVNDSGLTQIKARTERSNLEVACVTRHEHDGVHEVNCGDHEVTETFTFSGEGASLVKYNVYTDTLRHGEDLLQKGIDIQNKLASFDAILAEQKGYLDEFWRVSDVAVSGDDSLQEGIRFNLYHLLQSVGKDSVSNISAKGLSGEGYEGHYFWDTEIYIFPVFLMTNPEIAKGLLLHRYSTLDAARARAKEMGHKQGALFPWRTITGPESSAFFPAGTAQYHISADIAYSFIQYYLVTKDEQFKEDYLAEVLIETARLWADTGFMKDGKFLINNVTGPDEYTCIVNNNYYTNAMAKYNMEWAYKIYQDVQDRELVEKLGVTAEEAAFWNEAAENMFLPYNEELGINEQDDTFLNKEVWDLDNTSEEEYPLLLNYHPLTLYRYQVCKQADTVLAHFLVEDFADEEAIRKSYDYYERVTTHDSSLSYCVFSIMASKLGHDEKAYHYFNETARLDIDNLHKNTKDGLHMANMGGTWLAMVYGFAGLRVKEEGLNFAPRQVAAWDDFSFSLRFRGRLISVELKGGQVVYTLVEGDDVTIGHYDKKLQLTVDSPVAKSL